MLGGEELKPKKKVLILDRISEKMEKLCLDHAYPGTQIIFCRDDNDREEHIANSEILVTFTRGVPKGWISKAKRCILIQKLGAGTNNIDIEEASSRNIPVANTKGLNATSVAEHTVTLMTATLKHIVHAHNGIVLEDKWLKTELRDQSYQISYKKIGLVGFGNIGRQVNKILKGYECEVYYYDVYRLSKTEERKLGITYIELEDLIQKSNIISLHVPLNEQTHHLLNEKRLNKMKKNAVLINTCRGGVIDEKALYKVLKSGHLLGAGLDVFESEPITNENKLTKLPNVVLTPHIGGGTNEAMEAVIREAFCNINRVLSGGKADNERSLIN